MAGGFCTVGHSNRSLAEFVDLLREAGVQMVADVRRFPYSRTNPSYNIDNLPGELEPRQMTYCHLSDLGGRRPLQRQVPTSVNALWRDQSFHNYADYALSDQFAHAYDKLVSLGQDRVITIMCAEAVWWRCHRRIIADYLLVDGHGVTHLMKDGRRDAAVLTSGAVATAAGKVVYPSTE